MSGVRHEAFIEKKKMHSQALKNEEISLLKYYYKWQSTGVHISHVFVWKLRNHQGKPQPPVFYS